MVPLPTLHRHNINKYTLRSDKGTKKYQYKHITFYGKTEFMSSLRNLSYNREVTYICQKNTLYKKM